MKKLFLLGLVLFSGLGFAQQTDGNDIPVYSLDKCIEIALANNPNLGAAQSSLLGAEARVWESASNFWPQISASGSYGRSMQELTVPEDVFSYSNSARAGLNANWSIFTFGQDYYNYKAQKYNYTSAGFNYQNTVITTVYNVKQAYYNLIYAIKSVDVFQTSLEQYQSQLDSAQSFYKVGIRPKIDVTNAQVNLNTAKLALITGKNAVTVAYAALNNLLGLPNPVNYRVDDNLIFEEYNITMDAAMSQAYQNRPDYLAAKANTVSARYSLSAQKSNYLPDIGVNASYGLSGPNGLNYQNGSVGVSASWTLFDGLSTEMRYKEAKANYQSYQYLEEAARQNIIMDVTQAYSTLTQSGEAVPVSEFSVTQAQENLDLALGRYKVGIGSSLEVTDAESSFSSAKLQYAQSLTNYKIALAALLKAMGTK
ncbi:MAG: TolC family protein [Elusimicrobia bacterium]|nr:TolC family protein [Elusimicrobiota bacterium]